MTGWQKIKGAIETASYVAVILGVPLYFLQQLGERRSQRIESALQFILLANSDTYSQLQAKLSEPWQKIDVHALLQGRPTEQGIRQAKLAATANVADALIEQQVEFYNSVLICRNAGHCDARTLDDFFRSNIGGFYCSYEVRIALIARRLNRKDYASDLRDYGGPCV